MIRPSLRRVFCSIHRAPKERERPDKRGLDEVAGNDRLVVSVPIRVLPIHPRSARIRRFGYCTEAEETWRACERCRSRY